MIRGMSNALARNIQDVLREKNITPYAAAKGAGLGGSYVRDILRGNSKSPKTEQLMALAAFLEVPLERLTSGAPELRVPARLSARGRADRLPVRHVVQAGAWIEEDDQPQAPRLGPPIISDPAWAAEQWLEEVRGDSMDRIAPEGAVVQVADWADLGIEPRHGQVVVVQRVRAQGALRERSIKVVRISGDRIELWPDSTNPRWQTPLVLALDGADEDDIEVMLAGLVIWVHRPMGTRRDT